MIKRKFGMSCLNISQGRYSSFSHTYLNADDLSGDVPQAENFFAPCDWEVIGVYPYKTTGFANTVVFYDSANDVSIGMSHIDELLPNHKVGYVFKKGELCYREGVSGYATGPHIHHEIVHKRVPSKTKYSYGWALGNGSNTVNLEDYYYIDDSIKVRNTNNYKFEKGERMNIEYGMNVFSFNGANYKVIRANKSKGYDLHLITAEKTKDIFEFDSPDLTILGMVNCSYFEMGADNYGVHYGVEYDADLNQYKQTIKNDNVLCYNIKHDGTSEVLKTTEYELNASSRCAFSPYAVRIHKGNAEKIYWSSQFGDKDNASKPNTFAMKIGDDWCIGVVDNARPREIKEMGVSVGATELMIFDGGGSTQMVSMTSGKREKIVYTGRKIADVLALGKLIEDDDSTGEGGTQIDRDIEEFKTELKKKDKLIEQLNDKLSRIRGVIDE